MIALLVERAARHGGAARVDEAQAAYRRGHARQPAAHRLRRRGCSGATFTDILSGYRVFSRRFVKSFPALSRGFEIETELTVHALELELPVAEIATPYYARPEGSESSSTPGATACASCVTIFELYRSSGRSRSSVASASRSPRGDRPRDPARRHLSRDRPGAALPHRDPVDRADAAGVSVGRSPASSSTRSRAAGAR